MTVARKTKRRNKLETVAVEAMADLMSMTIPDAARKYGVTRQSMHQFAYRHAEELEELKQKVVERAETFEIEQKHYRLGETQELYTRAKAEIDLAEDTYSKVAAIKTANGLLRYAAEELGQLPRPDQNINVKAMMLIRQVEGADIEELS